MVPKQMAHAPQQRSPTAVMQPPVHCARTPTTPPPHPPVDLGCERAWVGHCKVVLLAVKLVKQLVQAGRDVPAALRGEGQYGK